ncbi:hypothetical protein WR25_25569 [Diploscapter pachys]|uniref:Uncharacterized protein n=1 Tax=Diploscapter pachys TaxID=2018661 RepID=A0A2A2LZ48_9BILA|nr:hypothetical protein WR25_25569 [Diploscapter pachys]
MRTPHYAICAESSSEEVSCFNMLGKLILRTTVARQMGFQQPKRSHNILHQMFQPQPAPSSNSKPLPISKDFSEPPKCTNIGPSKSSESTQPAKIIPLEEPEQEDEPPMTHSQMVAFLKEHRIFFEHTNTKFLNILVSKYERTPTLRAIVVDRTLSADDRFTEARLEK